MQESELHKFRRHLPGTLSVVRLTPDDTGRVVKTAVVSSSGSTRLDTAAVNAVQAMRCKPYIENGRAVAATAQQPISFELN
ncbi:energy transducer TonB [Cupriavidus sp. amp6]|uniref:energy transducer TonB n=1 Tax=Cupriavidus sp. amp6 TaxID=388051 RepID=UPI003510189E